MLFYKLRRRKWIFQERVKLKYAINKLHKKGEKIRIIVGAAYTKLEGWISTDLPFLDITSKSQWRFLFGKNRIDNLLTEHVIEHLNEEDVTIALNNIFFYLKKNGVCRIAVPDSFHPNPKYIEYVRPGGNGAGAKDHKTFWDYQSLKHLGENIGFQVRLQEFYDEDGNFHLNKYPLDRGIVYRSQLNIKQKKIIPDYSSLIVDMIK